jgi:hypothetical protein
MKNTDQRRMVLLLSFIKSNKKMPVVAYTCSISPFHRARFMMPNINSQNILRRKKGFELIFLISNRCKMTPNPYPKRIENMVINLL